MADNVLEPYTFSFGDAKPASNGCSSRVWVFPTSILLRKISRCIYVCIACNNYEASQGAFQIWKSFCKSNRPFSSSTWSGRLFFCSGGFCVCIRSKQGKFIPTRKFWIWFFKFSFKNTCWASPKPNIQHKIAPTAYLSSRWISKFSQKKIRSRKIVVDSFNIVQKRKYHFLKNRAILWHALSRAFSKKRKHSFRFLLGILLKSTENRKECFLKISSWLWYAFYKPSSNLENRMTVCMEYPAMTPQVGEPENAAARGGVGNPCRENGTQNPKSRWYEKPEPVVPILSWNSFHIP